MPIAELRVRSRTGLLKKHFETKYLLVDGRDGASVELQGGISFGKGLSQVVGLESRELEVLRAVEPSEERTVFDLVRQIRLSEDLVRSSLRALEERRLVMSYRRGRVKVYRRSVDLPKLRYYETPVAVGEIDESGARAKEDVDEG